MLILSHKQDYHNFYHAHPQKFSMCERGYNGPKAPFRQAVEWKLQHWNVWKAARHAQVYKWMPFSQHLISQ